MNFNFKTSLFARRESTTKCRACHWMFDGFDRSTVSDLSFQLRIQFNKRFVNIYNNFSKFSRKSDLPNPNSTIVSSTIAVFCMNCNGIIFILRVYVTTLRVHIYFSKDFFLSMALMLHYKRSELAGKQQKKIIQ